MTPTKIGLLVVTGLVLASMGTCGSCYLPRTEKVMITGTEVKRLDASDATTDVRYVLTQTYPDKETAVFRNEDTRFGWPPYFKFNAVDLSGDAARIAKSQTDAVVLITYYGFKSNVFNLQPNVIRMEVVDAKSEHLPLFNLIISGLAVIVVLFGTFKVWRWLSRREARAAATSEPSAAT